MAWTRKNLKVYTPITWPYKTLSKTSFGASPTLRRTQKEISCMLDELPGDFGSNLVYSLINFYPQSASLSDHDAPSKMFYTVSIPSNNLGDKSFLRGNRVGRFRSDSGPERVTSQKVVPKNLNYLQLFALKDQTYFILCLYQNMIIWFLLIIIIAIYIAVTLVAG
jgi:hypothetical protein